MDYERVRHFGQLFDNSVELPGAKPDATAIERRVGAAGQDAAPALTESDPVALAPDAGKRSK